MNQFQDKSAQKWTNFSSFLIEDGSDLSDVADRPCLDPLADSDRRLVHVTGAVGRTAAVRPAVTVDVRRLGPLTQRWIHVLK